MAFEDETGQWFVIASMDLIAIAPIIADPVTDAARGRHGLSRRQLLLTATHTHYGPEFRPDKQVFFNIPGGYGSKLVSTAEKLAAALTNVIDLALTRLEPVRLFARKTSVDFAHNRRRHCVVDGTPSVEDKFDHDVPVLDCVNSAGKRTAIVFGYACHNTTIPPDDLRYCGDWAGFAKEHLQEVNPETTPLFLPGAGADQDPEPRGSVELSRQYGQQMADAVQRSFEAPGVEINGPIRAERDDVLLALQAVRQNALRRMLESDDEPQRVKARYLLDQLDRGESLITSYSAPVQVIRFGNELLLIALSGEPVVDWGFKFKGEFARCSLGGQTPLVWVAGYSNDMFGYVPTRRVQAEGGYEGGRANLWCQLPAPFTDDLEDRITAAVRRLVERVSE